MRKQSLRYLGERLCLRRGKEGREGDREVGGVDLDGGEQEDRSPMATRDFSVRSRSVSCSVTPEGEGGGGKWTVIAIINVISVSKLQPQTSVCHPGCCWPASTLSIAAWERWRREGGG